MDPAAWNRQSMASGTAARKTGYERTSGEGAVTEMRIGCWILVLFLASVSAGCTSESPRADGPQPSERVGTPTRPEETPTLASPSEDVAVSEDVPELPTPASTLFEDDFSESGGGWPTEKSDAVTMAYHEGGMRIETLGERVTAAPAAPISKSSDSVSVSVTASLDDGEGLYGLFCKMDTRRENGYVFTLGSNGEYVIVKARNGEPITLKESGQRLPVIHSAPTPNKIRVDCQKKRRATVLRLVVNDALVVVLTDRDGLNGGRYILPGLYLQSLAGATAKFDDFSFSSLSDA